MEPEVNSTYEEILLNLASRGTVRIYTEEENIQIIKELNNGMESFLYDQRTRDKASEIELASVILNS